MTTKLPNRNGRTPPDEAEWNDSSDGSRQLTHVRDVFDPPTLRRCIRVLCSKSDVAEPQRRSFKYPVAASFPQELRDLS